ncbi:MAG: type IV pilus assembly protein PilM [Actinomycetota bacterium]|nr:type IV pilus assembly protein PilM [Actinomycetota bacterium]
MPRGTIGLDIGTSAVRAAEVKGNDPGTLVRFAQLSLPPGAIVAGEVVDPDRVAETLKDLWRRGGFKSKKVAISVSNQNVVVRQVEVPKMDEADLQGALGYQVADYIPMPIDDATLDFIVLDEFVGDDGAAMMRLLAVAALQDMINKFITVVNLAGLEPVSVDLSPLAAVRCLVGSFEPLVGEPVAEAVVDIGAGVTSIVVHIGGAPKFVRILSAGGSDITDSLVSVMSVSADEAEAEKAAVGLSPEGAQVASGSARVIEDRARGFIDDVRRSIEYYQSQPDAVRLSRVLVAGGGARLNGFAERLSHGLGLPVERADALGRVKVGDLGLTDDQLEQVAAVAAVSVGLAIEE